MRRLCQLAVISMALLGSAYAQTAFNCAVGFTASGSCKAGIFSSGVFEVVGTQNGSTPALSGSQVLLASTGATHTALSLMYQTAVNVQAFSTSFTFVPNGQNLAFTINNATGGSFNGPSFSSGAGCEGGFFQAFVPGNPLANKIFALMLDSYGGNTAGSGTFTYSNVQLYQINQSPCNPNDSGPNYWASNKISTSPVALNSPSGTFNTTTGDTYSATIDYDGSNLNLCLYDVTAATGSCSSGSAGTGTFFQQTWTAVDIPAMVNGNTAYIGFTEGTGSASSFPLYVAGWSYTVNAAPALPSLSSYTTKANAGASSAASVTFSPAAGTYTGTQNITLSSTTSGAKICYVLASPSSTLILPWPDGQGGCQNGTPYSSPVAVSSSQTLYAIAGTTYVGLPSAHTSAGYVINAAASTVNPSMSTAAIQSAINSAAAGSTFTFAAGTYSITSGLTLKCGVTYTATTQVTPSNVVLSAGFPEESTDIFTLNGGCTSATTVSYLSALHAGLIYVNSPSSNLTITHNQVGDLKCCRSDAFAPAINFSDPASGTTNIASNDTVTWNQLGDSTSCTTPTNAMTNTGSPETNQGVCAGMIISTSVNGLDIEHNNFVHVGEGVHVLCYGDRCSPGDSGGSGPTTYNLIAEFNDFRQIHRIAWEQQPEKISGVVYAYNSEHDWFSPYYGAFGISMACCANPASFSPFLKVLSNVITFNTAPAGRYGYGVEGFGTGLSGDPATYTNNMVQSNQSAGTGMVWGLNGNYVPSNFNYNYVCGSGFASGGYIQNEFPSHSPPLPTATTTGSITTPTCSASISAAPTISPSGGSYSFPLTVTLTDAGYNSTTALANGNTGIWYTTDGSTPVPGSGTAKRVDSGQTLVLPSAATVKAVGMWGAANQPTSYASGYGFVPSAVQTANYVASGGVTLSSVTIAPTAGISTLLVGGTVQMIVTCHYSDGSTSGCNTTDSHGSSVTNWASSNGNVTVSSTGLATGAAVGTAVITATVTGGFTTSPGATLTVNASPLTLSSVSIATAGGVSSINAGTTNQLIATCHYSDASTTSCSTMDSHGNGVSSYHSSAPTVATVTSGGLVTGVAAGSTNLTATVVPAPSVLGTSLENQSGATQFGFINEIYGVTGTSPGTYTPGNCHIIIPATTNWTAGKLWTCLLVIGTPTTQNASALCSNSYTMTGTSWPGGDIVISMASCPALPPDQGYWVGSTTSQTTASPAQGFSNCNSACSGGPPTAGSGTYAYRYVANTFGNYTNLPTTLTASGSPGQQVSQYLELTTTPVTSGPLTLTVTSAPPFLVSAYLTAGSSSMIVGNTMQMAAKCHYSSGPDQDCTVADVYGDAVSAWLSSDAAKATVNNVGATNPGLVTAVAQGTASITATIGGGTTSSPYPITITNPPVSLTGVSLSTAGGITGLFVGATNQLKATCTYSDESSDDCTTTDAHGNLAHSYVSTAPADATVNATSGLVTGVAPGSTTFTVVAGSFTSNPLPLAVFPVLSGIYTIILNGPVKFSGTVRF